MALDIYTRIFQVRPILTLAFFLPLTLSVCLSVRPSVCLSVCLSLALSFSLCLSLFLSLSLCLSVSLFFYFDENVKKPTKQTNKQNSFSLYKSYLSVCLTLFSYPFLDECPVDWTKNTRLSKCIKVFAPQRKNWNKARTVCKQHGGDLVKITDSRMNLFVWGM